MISRTALAATATTAALVSGAALAVSAHGQTQTTNRITLTAGQPAKRDVKQIDVQPRGESLGDETIEAVTVRLDDKPIGRLALDCKAVDASYQGRLCTLALLTRNGAIYAENAGEERPVPGHGGNPQTGDTFVITGGTGTYANATGTVAPRTVAHSQQILITLRSS
jgi:hypothetical protein